MDWKGVSVMGVRFCGEASIQSKKEMILRGLETMNSFACFRGLSKDLKEGEIQVREKRDKEYRLRIRRIL